VHYAGFYLKTLFLRISRRSWSFHPHFSLVIVIILSETESPMWKAISFLSSQIVCPIQLVSLCLFK
jgi:hypothetical protein